MVNNLEKKGYFPGDLMVINILVMDFKQPNIEQPKENHRKL